MPYHSTRARTLAAAAYAAHEGSSKAAVADFKQLAKSDAAGICRPDRFIKRWGKRLQEQGNTDTKQKSGRPRKLTQAQLQQCITEFVKGMKVGAT
jgi:transposase